MRAQEESYLNHAWSRFIDCKKRYLALRSNAMCGKGFSQSLVDMDDALQKRVFVSLQNAGL